MKEFPRQKFSHGEVKRAGKIIAGDLKVEGNVVPDEIQTAFRIASNWRDSHAYPMRSIHSSVQQCLRKLDLNGVSAARLKRMQAIRRKLRRIGPGLDQLQDLGGCRVILQDIADVNRLIDYIKDNLASPIWKEDDYIKKPKKDGYRSRHLIFKFKRRYPSVFDDKRIELQVRTRLQHSWATTVEAVGLFRGEELKNKQGDDRWLRLFELMSAEFAVAEKCIPIPAMRDANARRAEIKALSESLEAIKVLDRVTHGLRGPDIPLERNYKPSHYLIRYDFSKRTVSVVPYDGVKIATDSYDKAEELLRSGSDKDVVVLVEVDKIKNLKDAYPNYFGDVSLFRSQLVEICSGRPAVEYSVAIKQPRYRLPKDPAIDPGWMRGSRFPKPSFRKRK